MKKHCRAKNKRDIDHIIYSLVGMFMPIDYYSNKLEGDPLTLSITRYAAEYI